MQQRFCYRCLGETHHAISFPQTRFCGLNGRTTGRATLKRMERPEIARNDNKSDSYNRQPQNVHRDDTRVAPVRDTTEAESTQVLPERSHQTAMHMKETRGEYVALRKATVVIKNGARRVVVDAQLDDASSKTHINS